MRKTVTHDRADYLYLPKSLPLSLTHTHTHTHNNTHTHSGGRSLHVTVVCTVIVKSADLLLLSQ